MRWCSQSENSSMSFTSTICLYSSRKMAEVTICTGSCAYPFVMKAMALATRSGVLSSPSRVGSSPSSERISR